jgi:hypothetical protein
MEYFRAYPELAAIVGSVVPDFRGLCLRGLGAQTHSKINGSTVGITATTHASGALGVIQGDSIRNITGNLGVFDEELLDHPVFTGPFYAYFYSNYISSVGPGNDGGIVYMDLSRVIPTSNEIRPVNTSVRYLIRALP